MKKPFHSSRAFALVLVLIIVSFAAAIAVMYLLSVRQERSGASAYAQGTAVRELASQAVNLVIGQVNAATHEGTLTKPVSWASQPGMIRTYNTQGALSNAYKLYSWSNMIESGIGFAPASAPELPPATWSASPAQYTDINQPVNNVYPILDPGVFDIATSSSNFVGITNSNGIQWDFPGEAGLITQSSSYYPSTANKMPMPVQWLYILQDGSWSTPINPNGNTVTIPNASGSNPIVGRIAFWTDDETAKVNLNTASEGAFWDTPKAGTADELQFAGNPPLQTEYQRLAGHPATTSLSAIFPEFLGGAAGFSRWTAAGSPNSTFLTALQSIYGSGTSGSQTSHGINPRTSWGGSSTNGGSQGGTYPINSYLANYEPQVSIYLPSSSYYSPIPTNTDRLYATADDAYFQPTYSGSDIRADNVAFTNYKITPQYLSQRMFFLTADSQAPETTLYETPRVSMWPITWPDPTASYYVSSSPIRTVPAKPAALTPSPANLSSNPCMAFQEKLLSFCSTLNAGGTNTTQIYPYYFQRQDPDSPTSDWTNIPRNQTLVNYLTEELGDPNAPNALAAAPGIGTSLGAKWDADQPGTTDWITLNCFDYIRSMINQYTLNPNPPQAGALLYSYTAVNLGGLSQYGELNSFTAAPLNIPLNGNTYNTEGTYPALREASLVFYATQRNIPHFNKLAQPNTNTLVRDVQNPDNWSNLITSTGTSGNSQTTHMRMVVLLDFSEMMPGIYNPGEYTAVYRPVFWIKVSGSTPFKINGQSINFPLANGNVVQFYPRQTKPNPVSPEYSATLYSGTGAAKAFSDAVSSGSSSVWSLISDDIDLTKNPGPNPYSFNFTGSKIQIDVYAIDPSGNINIDPTGNPANLVYSRQLDFSTWNQTTAFFGGRASGQLPDPIAPYWNVRQAPLLSSGASVTSAVSLTSTATVSGGVLMPWFGNAGTASPNWQQEIVPQIGTIKNIDNPAYQWGTTRDFGSTSLDPSTSANNTSSLMYAYQCSTGTTTYTSCIFDDRVNALIGDTTLTGLTSDPQNGSFPGGASQTLFAGSGRTLGLEGYQIVTPYDTVISLVADPGSETGATAAGARAAGDPRLTGRGIAGGNVPFVPINQACPGIMPVNPITPITTGGLNFGTATGLLTYQAQYDELGSPGPFPQIVGIKPPWQFGNSMMAIRGGYTNTGSYPAVASYLMGQNDDTAGLAVDSNVSMTINPNWDWTRLPGAFSDGAYLLRPDQEYQSVFQQPAGYNTAALDVPFFSSAPIDEGSGSTNYSTPFFSPSRQVPSPVLLGTLPDSMTTGWQTLNFCPDPAVLMNSGAAHPGMGVANPPSATGAAYSSAPDHLLLDLFWMPVSEPYPISEEFATAGKVNLNYSIMPFPYIQRKTALDAVLKSVWLTAMPSPSVLSSFPAYYKSYGLLYETNRMDLAHTRYPINVDATLRAFDYKFQQGDIFRVASQICDMFLYPNDPNKPDTLWGGDNNTKGIAGADTPPSTKNITNWWASNSFTADNERESPYGAIYSRITTKSNTYTVHWRVQTLQKSMTSPSQWTEGVDKVASELRGSTLIERYIDPGAVLPDYAAYASSTSGQAPLPMSYYYKWRVDSESYFQPSP